MSTLKHPSEKVEPTRCVQIKHVLRHFVDLDASPRNASPVRTASFGTLYPAVRRMTFSCGLDVTPSKILAKLRLGTHYGPARA